MNTTVTTTPARSARRGNGSGVAHDAARDRGWRLSGRLRKTVLVGHIVASGAWLGMDAVLGILVVTAVVTPDAGITAVAAASIALFATWPLVIAGALALATGVVLGLGSKYGLFRYWWVLVKLVLNIVLVSLMIGVLVPDVQALSDSAREALVAGTDASVSAQMLYPPIVSSTALLVAMTLSVFKPWGRVSRAR